MTPEQKTTGWAASHRELLDGKPVGCYGRVVSTISYSTARDHLAEVWDKTISTREPVIVSRRGTESIVMLPLHEWEGLQETAHLLRSPSNAKRLLASLVRIEQGEGEQLSMEALAARSGRK